MTMQSFKNSEGGVIIGIDLGTTHSLAAVWRNGRSELIPNAIGEFLTPSVVSLDNDGCILIGQAAKERLQTHPTLTAAGFKRFMGSAHINLLGEQPFRAEDLSSLVLRSLKQDAENYLDQPVYEAVVTVPAYFSDVQRQATRDAAILAGFQQVTLLNEPTAAALAYGLHQEREETQFLVFDLGGGTFDVSVLELFEGVMEVKATAGDNNLGGDDIDQALIQQFFEKTSAPSTLRNDAQTMSYLLARAECAKCALATQEAATIRLSLPDTLYEMTLDQVGLAEALAPFLERLSIPIERALRDAKLRSTELDAVVLAGGSTRLLAVRQLVTKLFGRFPEIALNPDKVVALGAAVQAGLRAKDAALSERVMTDVCPYSLGIEVSKQMADGRYAGGYMSTVLERNTAIPASRVQRFSPLRDNQETLQVRVFQGESRRANDNIELGQFDLPLPKGKKEQVGADVRFTYDVSGLLEVEATPTKNYQPYGRPNKLVIESSGQRLSEAQIEQRLAILSAIKVHPRDRLEARTLLARAERIHTQLLGNERELIASTITTFEWTLESQDETKISHAKRHLTALLDRVEKDKYLHSDPI
jgi:molecular chaperone HscC